MPLKRGFFLPKFLWGAFYTHSLNLEWSVNLFPKKPWFLRACSGSLLKIPWEKEKLLVTSNFSFSHSVFYPSGELSAIFTTNRNCRLQTLSISKSQEFVVWERVNKIHGFKSNWSPYLPTHSLEHPLSILQDFVKFKVTQLLIG